MYNFFRIKCFHHSKFFFLRFYFKAISIPNMGLESTMLRSRVKCSIDWNSHASLIIQFFKKLCSGFLFHRSFKDDLALLLSLKITSNIFFQNSGLSQFLAFFSCQKLALSILRVLFVFLDAWIYYDKSEKKILWNKLKSKLIYFKYNKVFLGFGLSVPLSCCALCTSKRENMIRCSPNLFNCGSFCFLWHISWNQCP